MRVFLHPEFPDYSHIAVLLARNNVQTASISRDDYFNLLAKAK
jgi:hypothetical protein